MCLKNSNFAGMKAWIDEYSEWIPETNPKILKEVFGNMLLQSGFGVINFMEHFFEPQGYTALWLISESHFAVHTFPEEEKTYIHLSSCSSDMYYKFLDLLKDYKNNASG